MYTWIYKRERWHYSVCHTYNCNNFQRMYICIAKGQHWSRRLCDPVILESSKHQHASTIQKLIIVTYILTQWYLHKSNMFSPDIINYTTNIDIYTENLLSVHFCHFCAICNLWLSVTVLASASILLIVVKAVITRTDTIILVQCPFLKARAYLSLLFCTHHCQRRLVKRQPQWGIIESKIWDNFEKFSRLPQSDNLGTFRPHLILKLSGMIN